MLRAATAISVIGVLLLLASAWWQTPDWTLFVSALLAGFMPSMSAIVRARWTATYWGQVRLPTAYSLETVLNEVAFIAGPPLSVAVFPQAGPLAAAVLLPIGVLALVVQCSTEPPVEAQDAAMDCSGSVIRLPNVPLLALLMVAMGGIVGTVDIVSVVFAEQQGQPSGSVGLCGRFLPVRSAVRRAQIADSVAPLVIAGRAGDGRDDAAPAAGRQCLRIGRSCVRRGPIFRANDDRGDVADRANGAGAPTDRRRDLAAGRAERRSGARRSGVRSRGG